MLRFPFLSVIVCSLVLLGCTESTVEPPDALPVVSSSIDGYLYVTSNPDHRQIHEWGKLPADEQDEARAESREIMRRAIAATSHILQPLGDRPLDAPPEEFRRRLSEVADRLEGYEQNEIAYMIEQQVAFILLNEYLADGDLQNLLQSRIDLVPTRSEQKAALVGLATELLVRNHTPHADLVAASLKVLEDIWAPSKIVTTARQTSEAAEAWLDSSEHGTKISVSDQQQSSRIRAIRGGIALLNSYEIP